MGPTKAKAAVPSKKSTHSQFVAALPGSLPGSLPGAGTAGVEAVAARPTAAGAGGRMTKEVCMAVGKRGVLVALLGRYPVPGPGRASAGTVALRDGFPSPGWPGAQTGHGTPPLGMLPGWPAPPLARRAGWRPDSPIP